MLYLVLHGTWQSVGRVFDYGSSLSSAPFGMALVHIFSRLSYERLLKYSSETILAYVVFQLLTCTLAIPFASLKIAFLILINPLSICFTPPLTKSCPPDQPCSAKAPVS